MPDTHEDRFQIIFDKMNPTSIPSEGGTQADPDPDVMAVRALSAELDEIRELRRIVMEIDSGEQVFLTRS
jgi:hypothetical protein